ncbi:50S ribosomal protein L13e, variant [Fonticula alba]|nr:50S ribosomal protein L13e, variant [Fonticula alba]KCV72345.1 50S ribosomal protein L13e, variant [Fonticula alba]|eukprot:XP_009493922.1 50S ribosomal protein L13e, variant [Fonticula alba]
MVKGNHIIPGSHFRKHWFRNVKTWFDQPGQKKARRVARAQKAIAIAPRPVAGLLRPAVHCQTQKYNAKVRLGRGFTLEELKLAGVCKRKALSIGIAVDHRRKNRSQESLDANVARLKAYKEKLIVFPKNATKATNEDLKNAVQFTGPLFPLEKKPAVAVTTVPVDTLKTSTNVFLLQGQLRRSVKFGGMRAKSAADKAAKQELLNRK